ncbi:MAG TPA: aminoacyl-tRNA hydrolase [Bacillota bacterium]|nr:aminoacyl-tRNA hydrolase [Bacillota bacterium]HRX91351.1 aminoacyl-tRNA hydrolase [Candidatus Izemoplasmatales bacterium]
MIVGLGNPGRKYAKTRHNVGFMCLDAYAKTKKAKFSKETKFMGEVLTIGETIFLKPKTFMNLSGNSVKAVAGFYKIPVEEIMVISDDMDLPLAKIRLREKGGSGGHNGLKSIISQMGTEAFKRVRIGIGHSEENDTVDYVLSGFSKAESKMLDDTIIECMGIIDDFQNGKPFEETMNRYN